MISILLFIGAIIFYTFSQQANFKDPDGWKNKYKQPMVPGKQNWYYKLFDLKYQEKFLLSGTALVFLTDRMHFYQMIFKILLSLAIAYNAEVFNAWEAVLYWAVFTGTFSVAYRF